MAGIWQTELVLVQAPTRAELIARLETLERELAAASEASLANVAFTLNRAWTPGQSCLAVVAKTTDELTRKVAHARKRLQDPNRKRIQDRSGIFYFDEHLADQGTVAFLFPGEGAQYPNMLRDVCAAFPEARKAFDLADRACADVGDGFLPSALIFPPSVSEADERLWGMEAAIEAVVSADTALMHIVEKLDIRPDAVLGHSSGELIAVEQAGVIRYADDDARVDGLRNGYRLMKELANREGIPDGILLTAGGVDRPTIDAHLERHRGDLILAMDNCPHQVVLCAVPGIADAVEASLMNEGAIVVPLPFTRPYHTAWFAPALDAVRAYFLTHSIQAPTTAFYSCATAARFPDDPPGVLDLCVDQWARPVRFQETIETMYADGVRIFVEIGPRGNLTAFTDDILKDRPHLAVASNRINRSGLDQLNLALGLLAAHGVSMNPAMLHAHRPSRVIALPWGGSPETSGRAICFSKPMPRIRLEGMAPLLPSLACPAEASERRREADGVSSGATPVTEGLQAYLGAMEQFLSSQQAVMGAVLAVESKSAPTPVRVPRMALNPSVIKAVDDMPLLSRAVDYVPGERLVCLNTVDLDEAVWIRNHAIGTSSVSVLDPDLGGYPVMPFPGTLELAAETAAALMPGKVVIGFRDATAHQWVRFEHGRRTLRSAATVMGSGAETLVRVEIRDADSGDDLAAYDSVLAEATVVLADAYPEPPDIDPVTWRGEKPAGWSGEQIYPERLFHGPRFQTLQTITRWAENGLEGVLNVMPRSTWFRSEPKPNLTFDPVALDGLSQALGVWGTYVPMTGLVAFPYSAREIRFYGPPPAEGATLSFVIQVRDSRESSVTADMIACDADGRVCIETNGWTDGVFDVTAPLHAATQVPLERMMSAFVPPPSGLTAGAVCGVTPPESAKLLKTGHPIWSDILRFVSLGRRERAQWATLPPDRVARVGWLVGRVAVKDAVRRFLMERDGLKMAAADVTVREVEGGGVSVDGDWRDRTTGPVSVSVVVRGCRAAAVACAANHLRPAVIDASLAKNCSK